MPLLLIRVLLRKRTNGKYTCMYLAIAIGMPVERLIYLSKKRMIIRNWLLQLWSPKFQDLWLANETPRRAYE